jgi:hypothetical protein
MKRIKGPSSIKKGAVDHPGGATGEVSFIDWRVGLLAECEACCGQAFDNYLHLSVKRQGDPAEIPVRQRCAD